MSGITTHVLDTSNGSPASQLTVRLAVEDGDGWRELSRSSTGADGRARLTGERELLEVARYRLRFEVEGWFAARSVTGFYPRVDICFTVSRPEEHYHVPLLLSPFGYSTYRGS